MASETMPTFKECFERFPNVYKKLNAMELTDMNTFLYMDSADLDKLCKSELGLKFVEAVKLKSYIRQIQSKYIGKMTMFADDFKNMEVQKNDKNVEKIPLRFHSQRKCYTESGNKSWPASNLIGSGYYCSALNRDFKNGESDWMIFEWVQLYVPTKVVIQQHGICKQNLKTMSLWIGNDKEWFPLKPGFINVGQTRDHQSFEIHGVDIALVKTKLLNRIKFELVSNHGEFQESKCKFYLQNVGLYGIKL